ACAASASYGLAGVFWSACFISLAVSDCAGTFNTRAGCAADMTSLMGTTSYLSSAISSMLLNCHGAVGLEELKVQEMGGRRLAHRRLDWKTSEAYNISQKVKVLEANQDWHSVGCAFVGLVNLAVARDVDKTDFAAGGRAKIAFCSAFIFFVWGAQNTYFCIMRQDVFKKFMWFNALACLGTAALSFHAGVSQ
ncbi:unnamed protein product, partial [Effrenium voratum]